MVHVVGDNTRPAEAELTFNQIMKTDGGAKLLDGHRKIGVLHLPGQSCLQVVAPAPWRIEIPLIAGNEERREKREPLDMVPVRVGDQQVSAHGLRSRGKQRLPETMRSGAAIEDDEGPVGWPHLHTGGVASVAQRRRPWRGQRSPRPPEPDPYHGMSHPSRVGGIIMRSSSAWNKV